MKPSTPGFVGESLREAREARGLSASALAEIVGLSRQAISQYERGKHTPRPETMEAISSTLNVPQQFFLESPTPEHEATVFFRSMSAATKTARRRAEVRLGWVKRVVYYVESLVQLPDPDFPDFDLPDDALALGDHDIEEFAAATRRQWGLGDGPISNVAWLLENKGGIVVRGAVDAETLDAFSTWMLPSVAPGDPVVHARPIFFLAADKDSAVRSRFDAAHELGEVLLHRNVPTKRLRKPGEFQKLERQMHRFASAFLLPERTFVSEISSITLDGFRALKTRWKVAIGAMLMRVRDLDIVSDDEFKRLWIAYTRRGWRRREPLDDELAPEEPRLLKRALDLIYEQGVRSRDDIAHRTRLSKRDIEELAGLPERYLSSETTTVLKLRPERRAHPDAGSGGDDTSSVIEFPGTRRQP